MSTIIRNATVDDIEWLLPQLREFSKMCGLSRPIVGNDEHSRRFLAESIKAGPFFIAERDAIRLGFIAGEIHQHRFNPELKILSEMFFYVDPRFRFSRAGLMLLEHFKLHGKLHADLITFSLLDGSPVKTESLIKRGFRPMENSFVLEVA